MMYHQPPEDGKPYEYPVAPPHLFPQPPPPKKPNWLIVGLAGGTTALFIVFAAVAAVAAAADGPEPDQPGIERGHDEVRQAPTADEPADEPEPVYYEPTDDDFELTVKVLSQECFGSAGCLVEFRVELGWSELADNQITDPAVTYEVTYEVTGGEDRYIDTIEVTGEEYLAPGDDMISTPSSESDLVATVTEVAEQ